MAEPQRPHAVRNVQSEVSRGGKFSEGSSDPLVWQPLDEERLANHDMPFGFPRLITSSPSGYHELF